MNPENKRHILHILVFNILAGNLLGLLLLFFALAPLGTKMESKELERRAIEAVRTRNRDGEDFNVTSVTRDFLEGTLCIVEFKISNTTQENLVHITGNDIAVLKRTEELVRTVQSAKTDVLRDLRVFGLNEIIKVGGISGVIAFVLTLTICAGFLLYPDKVLPDVLGHALTTILGFYFGSKTVAK